jgi:hypothetical protein
MWRAEPYALGMLGELVQTMAGKWITHPPARWPNVIKSRLVSVRGCQVGRSGTDADMSWPPPLVDRGLRRGLGRETELREPVLHVEVEPVARDNPVLDRRGVALAKAHTPARRGNRLAVRPRH